MKIYLKDAKQLQELLIRNGFTKASFSKHINIHRSYLQKLINEQQSIGVPTADKMCKALNVEFDDIFLIKVSTKVS